MKLAGQKFTMHERMICKLPILAGFIFLANNFADIEQFKALIAEISAFREQEGLPGRHLPSVAPGGERRGWRRRETRDAGA